MAGVAGDGIGSLVRLAWITRGLLVAQIVLDVLLVGAGGAILYFFVTRPAGGFYAMAGSPIIAPLTLISGLLGVLFILTSLVLAITFMLWVYRAWRNLYDVGVADLGFSPGWAVGSFFVPFLNLVLPFRSMRELTNRSAGEDVWQAMQTAPDVSAWWSFLIGGAILRSIVMVVQFVGRIPYVCVTTPLSATIGNSLFATCLMAASSFYLRRAIGEITGNQRAMRHASGAFD